MGNSVHITGQVVKGRYPYAIKESKTGAHFIPLSVATYRTEIRRDEGEVSIPTYHRVVVYGNENFLERSILPLLMIGAPVCICGEIRYSTLFDDDGRRKQLSEIIVFPNQNIGYIEFPDYQARSEHVS